MGNFELDSEIPSGWGQNSTMKTKKCGEFRRWLMLVDIDEKEEGGNECGLCELIWERLVELGLDGEGEADREREYCLQSTIHLELGNMYRVWFVSLFDDEKEDEIDGDEGLRSENKKRIKKKRDSLDWNSLERIASEST